MKLQQLESLTEDELAMLWFILNKVNPPVIAGFELEPSLFVSIKHRRLMDRILQCAQHVKEEHHAVFTGLVNKLKVS